jgi:hypothetical protein
MLFTTLSNDMTYLRNHRRFLSRISAFISFVILVNLSAAKAAAILDTIVFGDAASEKNHAFAGDHTRIISGRLGDPARIALPQTDPAWEGERLAFTLAVDPQKQNYLTVRLSGSDATQNQLVLFCEGKQVGYRHLGDIEILDIGGEEPAFPGRFIYNTTPLPLPLTRGKTNLNFEIRSYGPTWGYTGEFEKFQKPLAGPTRGIYKIYSHTDSTFVPPTGEKQGTAPAALPVRTTPGAEVLDQVKTRVDGEVKRFLASKSPLNQPQMQFLANAYFVKWTSAFQNPQVVTQVLKSLDATFAAYRENPKLAQAEPTTYNPEWFGLGMAGNALQLLSGQLKPFLDEEISGAGKKISRRAAYSEMFVASRDWHRKHRRLYTNQTMINDLFGIYLCNRAVEVVDPANALSEIAARRYLYESVGLEPWRDSDPGGDAARETAGRGWNVGTNYWELTAKGLTKELGYVGYYGEVLDWATTIYDATRPVPGAPGDDKIKMQLEKIANARAPFRYAAADSDGFRAMRIESVVGWRDSGHYPGNVAYAERSTWDASSLYEAAATLNFNSIGYAQQMFADNQFFISLERQMAQGNSIRVTAGLLGVPDEYDLIKAQSPVAKRLPMSPGAPDFVFSDEEDGVVAIKNGDEIFYASLYWRSRYAVNSLARIHFTRPCMDQIAVVAEDVQFEPAGEFYSRPNWTTFGFGNGGPKYPGNLQSAHTGEKLPVAKIPGDVRFRVGDESVYAGKAEFYSLRWGNYLIGMNLTTDKTFELKTPPELAEAKELVSEKRLKLNSPLNVGPRSTVVLYFGK